MFNIYNQPARQLKTNRGLIKLLLLSLITFGIYTIIFYSNMSTDIEVIASKYDGKKTMHYCLLIFIFTPITFGIATFVWNHNFANRLGKELKRRGIIYHLSSFDFWIWGVLGSLIVVGPFIYTYKIIKSMNLLSADYNVKG